MVCKYTVLAKVLSVHYLYFFLLEGVTLKCYISHTLLKVLFAEVPKCCRYSLKSVW